MKLKDFKFNDDDVKVDFVRSNNIEQKINFALKYLVNHLPVNKLKKDNSFDFSSLKFNEGKNYDWFFLNNKNTTILIRQYQTHFTFFTKHKSDGDYKSRLCVFTITENTEKMDDDLSDSFCDDNFLNITKYLPELVKLIENDTVHSIWNNYSFKVPKYTDVKIGMIGPENIHSLDVLIFASDELFSMYLSFYF